jgi:DNA-binding NarL/FixJ family response regulator
VAVPKEIAERIALLTDFEVAIFERVARGDTNADLPASLGVELSVATITKRLRSAQDKIGLPRSRVATGLFYVRHILPVDMRGKPEASHKSAYATPGEKLAEWVTWAKKQHAYMWSHGMPRGPLAFEILQLVSDPAYAELSLDDVGPLLVNDPSGTAVKRYVNRAMGLMHGGGCRVKLATVHTLAPFLESQLYGEAERRRAGYTRRELQVLGLLAEGMSDEQIAGRLFISAATVKTHSLRIGRKIGKGGRRCAVHLYIDALLPYDLEGGYKEPGEKLAVWRKRAEVARARLRDRGLTLKQLLAIELVGDPKNANKTNAWIAKELTRICQFTSETEVKEIWRYVYPMLGGQRNRVGVVVMQRLAPIRITL